MEPMSEPSEEEHSTNTNDGAGYIYIIFNDMFRHCGDNVYKIGKTKDITSRIQQYVTSYVKPVEIKYLSQPCVNYHIAEMLVFIRLNEQRLVGNREFFDINIELAVACIDNVVDFVNADTSGAQEEIRAHQEQYKQMKKQMKKQDCSKSERCKERRKIYYELNKEVLKEKTRIWKQENKERVREVVKSYHDSHRDEEKSKNKARYQQNRDKLLAKGKEWRKNNRDKIKEYERSVKCSI